MSAAILLLVTGFLLVCYGAVRGINLAIQMWWLLCQICFKDLNKISYEISMFHRWLIVAPIVAGIIAIVFGFRLLP